MKNLIIVLTVIIFFSCSMIEPNYNWYDCKVPSDLKTFDRGYTKESQVAVWVMHNIDYKLYANGFHSVQQTLNEMQGNCANRALTILAIYYQTTGEKGQLIYCWHDNGKTKGLHYAAKINGYIMEGEYITQTYDVIDFDDITEYIYYRQ